MEITGNRIVDFAIAGLGNGVLGAIGGFLCTRSVSYLSSGASGIPFTIPTWPSLVFGAVALLTHTVTAPIFDKLFDRWDMEEGVEKNAITLIKWSFKLMVDIGTGAIATALAFGGWAQLTALIASSGILGFAAVAMLVTAIAASVLFVPAAIMLSNSDDTVWS